MARKVISGLIQMSNVINEDNVPVKKVADAMLEKHLPMIDEAGKKGVASSYNSICSTYNACPADPDRDVCLLHRTLCTKPANIIGARNRDGDHRDKEFYGTVDLG